jgi:hypothetical protein
MLCLRLLPTAASDEDLMPGSFWSDKLGIEKMEEAETENKEF